MNEHDIKFRVQGDLGNLSDVRKKTQRSTVPRSSPSRARGSGVHGSPPELARAAVPPLMGFPANDTDLAAPVPPGVYLHQQVQNLTK